MKTLSKLFAVLLLLFFNTSYAYACEDVYISELLMNKLLVSENVEDINFISNEILYLKKEEAIPVLLEVLYQSLNTPQMPYNSARIFNSLKVLHKLAEEGIYSLNEVPVMIKTLKIIGFSEKGSYAADILKIITSVDTGGHSKELADSSGDGDESILQKEQAALLKWETYWEETKSRFNLELCDNISKIKYFPVQYLLSYNDYDLMLDETYSRFIRAGNVVIPCLIEKITNTDKSNLKPVFLKDDLTIGDLSFIILLDITGLQPSYFLDNNASYSDIFSLKNEDRKKIQNKYLKWYEDNKKSTGTIKKGKKIAIPSKYALPFENSIITENIKKMYSFGKARKLEAIDNLYNLASEGRLSKEKIKELNLLVEYILPFLEDEDVFMRAKVAKTLGAFRGNTKVIEPLINALKDESWRVRANAATALGKIKAITALNYFINLLDDDSLNVNVEAIIALGEIRDRRALLPLMNVLKGKEGKVKETIEKAINKIQSKTQE